MENNSMKEKWTLDEIYNLKDFNWLTNAIGEECSGISIPAGVRQWYDDALLLDAPALLYLVKIQQQYNILAIYEFDEVTCTDFFSGDIEAMHKYVKYKVSSLDENTEYADCIFYAGIETGHENCDEIGVLFSMYSHTSDMVSKKASELHSFIYDTEDAQFRNRDFIQSLIHELNTLDKLVISGHEKAQTKTEKLKSLIDFVNECSQHKVDLTKEYYLTDNIYLQFSLDYQFEKLYGYFYFADDSFIYKDFLSSHSGLNDWLTGIVKNAIVTCTRDTDDYFEDITDVSVVEKLIRLITNDSREKEYIIKCVHSALSFADKSSDSICDKIKIIRSLYDNTPDGVVTDADTIFADIMDANDMHETGISTDIFNIWEKSHDRKSVEMMFFEFTGVEFAEYLDSCIEKTTRKEEINFGYETGGEQ